MYSGMLDVGGPRYGGGGKSDGYDIGKMMEQRRAVAESPDNRRELFEQGLLQQEQQRRQYDSETQRMGQQQKYGVLGGLLKGMGTPSYGGMSGYGPMGFGSRVTFGRS